MQRFIFIHLPRALACAVLLASAAHAAELGDVSPRSFIGQPLAADIELVALAPDEINALQVRLAQADVFRGANITMNPALSSVRMAVVKRDQKQFLHVTTTRPVEADYVHLYLELSAAGRHDVRLATVWLQADPNPPPPPVAPALAAPTDATTSADASQLAARVRAERAPGVAVPASPAVAASTARDRLRPAPLPSAHESEIGVPGAVRAAAPPATTVRQAPVAVRDLASRIADAMGTPRVERTPSASASAPATAHVSAAGSASAAAATSAAAPGSSAGSASAAAPAHAAVSGAMPAKPAAKREAATADGAVPLPVSQALLPLPPLPLPAGVKRAAAPAACTPSGISARECKALDTHSAALSSKLVELEGKMKALQGAIAHSAAVAPKVELASAAKTDHAGAARPEPASAAKLDHASAGKLEQASAAKTEHAGAAKTEQAGEAAAPKVGQAGTAVLAAAGSSVAAAVASPLVPGQGAPKSASVASAAPGAVSASASADEHGASASASAAGAAASASTPVPLKRVLPKLKYKKEKPAERPPNYLAWGAGAVGVLALAGAALIHRRRKKSGAAPLKIWQGFRRKKPADAAVQPQEAPPLHEVTPESIT